VLSLAELSAESFLPLVGQKFLLVDGTESIELELLTVKAGSKPLANSPLRAPFSLQFRAQSGPAKPQRIYRLENERFGAAELFVVPFRLDKTGCYYNVTFN
jgi:hypothetical protein